MQSSKMLSLLSLTALAAFAITAFSAPAPEKKGTSKKSAPSKPTAIVWQKDIEKAFKQAKKDHKMVMADFYTESCVWCKVLDKKVYTDTNVKAFAGKRFVSLKLNPEKDEKAGALAEKLGVQGFPTIVFFTEKGRAVHGILGFKEAPEFLADMKRALERAKK